MRYAWKRSIPVVLVPIFLIAGCPATDPQGNDPNGPPQGKDAQGEPAGDGVDQQPGETPLDDFSEELSGDSQKTTAYRDQLTSDEAYHFLRRAALGATHEDVARVVDVGLEAAVDDLLAKKTVPGWVEQLAASHENNLDRRWMVYLLESPNPLHERMAMFWHDRFATSRTAASDWRHRSLPLKHFEMLRKNALGDYREFLEDITLDPLMLLWLDGADSPKENPNENYAREYLELYTLGRDVLYTEADIREGARAFTGTILLYSNDEDPRPVFDIYHHDETMKLVFPDRAVAENHDYESIIDLTLQQPEAAEYVARNLFVFFVHNEPSDEVVQELADLFVSEGLAIKPPVRRILMSQALFSAEARYCQVTSPVEHLVGVARTLDMHMVSEDSRGWVFEQLVRDLREAGQELMSPPSVAGWDEGEAWLQDQWIMERAEAFSRVMEYGENETADLPYHLLPSTGRWDQREIRNEIVQAVAAAFHIELTEDEEDIYVEVLDQNGYLAFHLSDPEHHAQHVFEMIRLMAMDERVIVR